LLPADLNSDDYHLGQQQIPALSASASRDKAGTKEPRVVPFDSEDCGSEDHCPNQLVEDKLYRYWTDVR